jgi:hypothetical protein
MQERLDSMWPGWLLEAEAAILQGDAVTIFDWRPKGASRLIRIWPQQFPPHRPVRPTLKKILKSEGMTPSRFKRGVQQYA